MKVNVYEPILIPDIIIEILEYLAKEYKDRTKSHAIKKHDDINIDLFKEDLDKLCDAYYSKYGIDIKYI